jgi:hypothetical protein
MFEEALDDSIHNEEGQCVPWGYICAFSSFAFAFVLCLRAMYGVLIRLWIDCTVCHSVCYFFNVGMHFTKQSMRVHQRAPIKHNAALCLRHMSSLKYAVHDCTS